MRKMTVSSLISVENLSNDPEEEYDDMRSDDSYENTELKVNRKFLQGKFLSHLHVLMCF